jgi:uncharacterized MnhB-related membrane protein
MNDQALAGGAVNAVWWTLDLALCGAALWLAWQSLTAARLFQGVVLFIMFGLVIALVWARLDAPDIAMAEAAIGAGITGALLLATLTALEGQPPPPVRTPEDPSS